MASERVIVWFILCFPCILQFHISICLGWDVPSDQGARTGHQKNTSEGVHLHTSCDVTVRLGERLQINCTIFGALGNFSKYQLSWYRGAQRLTNITKTLNNETIQLVIDHVDWDNNGMYICKGNGRNGVQPKHVAVTVGDIPSPPQAVWTNNVEFRTRIHWTASTHSGGLPLSYAVRGQCKNVTYPDLPECETETFTLCETSSIYSAPESNKFVCEVMPVIHQDVVIYDAFVEANNDLGSSRSSPVEFKANIHDPLLTTPQPKVSFAAKEVIPAGTVKLAWDDANWQLRPIAVQYTILYHRVGDSHNKSFTVHPPRVNILISGLTGFSLYYFYFLVQYGSKHTNTYGTYSEAAVQTVRTNMSAPSHPPTITNCSHWSNHSNYPGLIVTWAIPAAEYLNGPLQNTVVYYLCRRGSQEIAGNVTVRNMTARSVVIAAMQPSDKCHVWMIICNGPQFCSAISNTCLVPVRRSSKDNSSSPPTNSKGSVLETAIISVVGSLCGLGLVILIVLWIRSRRRDRGERRPALASVLAMPLVTHGYDEIGEPLLNNNYDVIAV